MYDLFLISLDCVRHDFLGCCAGNSQVKTPTIDKLAAEGVIFTEAVCHTPYTPPSHASLLTGLYPFHHGVRLLMGQYLCPEIPTLGSILKTRGYFTAGFPSVFLLGKRYGFNNGFDWYDDEMTTLRPGFRGPFRPGQMTTEAVLSFLESSLSKNQPAKPDPIFIFLHYFDAHDYNPGKPESMSKYIQKIEETDNYLNMIISRLKEMGRWDRMITIITADHGDSFGEHGLHGHGKGLYDDTLRIPLIIRAPGLIPPRSVIDQQVRLIDILPTALDLSGSSSPDASFDGVSLIPCLNGQDLNLGSYSETSPIQLFKGDKWQIKEFTGPEIIGWRKKGWKYIRGDYQPGKNKGGRKRYIQTMCSWLLSRVRRRRNEKIEDEDKEELYDLKVDKEEKHNLIGREGSKSWGPEMGRQLDDLLLKVPLGFCTTDWFSMDDQEMAAVKERLESLGYL